MKFQRWSLIILILLVLGITQWSFSVVLAQATPKSFTFGSTNIVRAKDPALVQDFAGFGMLDAVIEPLFVIDYTTEGIPIVNCLATNSRWHNATSFEIDLRENVLFHDGTPFNATVAKWNLDREMYWMSDLDGVQSYSYWVDADLFAGLTGWDLNWTDYDRFENGSIIYYDIDGEMWADPEMGSPSRPVWIINNTEIVSDYQIRINLNFPFAQIKNKLATNIMGMLSMYSHADNWDVEIGLNDPLIGTGPFKFVSHSETALQTKFAQNPDYWRGAPEIEEMTFVYYDDPDALDISLLSGELDYTVEFQEESRADIEDNPDLTILPGVPEVYMHMISMNTQRINQTMRKAIAYAVNYDYIISEALDVEAVRQIGPIPEGKQYYNPEIPYATLNLSLARQTLIDAGVASAALSLTDDAPWIAIAQSITPLAEYTLPVPESPDWLGVVLAQDLAKIGVKLNSYILSWDDYYPGQQLYNLTGNDLIYQDWSWDGGDPTQELIDQYAVGQDTNFGLLNDAQIDEWVYLQIVETDDEAKQERFDEITYRLQQELFPCLYLWQNMVHSVIRTSRWTNVTQNAYNAYNFYPAHWVGTEKPGIPGYPLVFVIAALFVWQIYLMQKKSLRKR